MRSVSLRLVDLERKPLIPLGFEGENEYMTINFDCKTVFDKHPAAVPTLAVTPPQGDSYPAVVVRDGDIVSWTVCDSDLVYPGEGELQLTFVDGTIIGKTYKARTKVLDSITPSGEAPTPIQNWLIQAAAALQALPTEVASSVAALMGAMVGVGETLDPDDDVTVNYDPVNNTLTIGVPKGKDGDPTEIIDDTSGDGDTDKTWSSDKLDYEFNGKANKYNTVLTSTLSRGRREGSSVGKWSFAFGNSVVASGETSHAEGLMSTASGENSHAEGHGTLASKARAHAEGYSTQANGANAHSEGYDTRANGECSHAEGDRNIASGENSHAEGFFTVANHKSQHVFGEHNIADDSSASASNKGNYVEIVGNGTGANAKSNARTLDWDGNEELAGDLTIKKGTADEISVLSLKTEINSKADEDVLEEIVSAVIGSNLFDNNFDESGYIDSNGADQPGSNWIRTSTYYPIDDSHSTLYSYNQDSGGTTNIYFYTSAKVFISKADLSGVSQSKSIPEDAAFFRLYRNATKTQPITLTYEYKGQYEPYGLVVTMKSGVVHYATLDAELQAKIDAITTASETATAAQQAVAELIVNKSTINLFDSDFDESGYIDDANGDKPSNNYVRTSKYYPVDDSNAKIYSYNPDNGNTTELLFYTSEKVFISRVDIASKSTNKNIPEGAAYFRLYRNNYKTQPITITYTYENRTIPYRHWSEVKEDMVGYDSVNLEGKRMLGSVLAGRKILVFGDSIIGNDRTEGVCDFLAEYSGATVYNGAVGGTRITDLRSSQYDSPNLVYFDGVKLVHALMTDTWTDQDAHTSDAPTYVAEATLPMLKALDCTTLDVIVIAYGRNDVTSNETTANIESALATIIDDIQSTYPNIRILVLTPVWGMFTNKTVDGDEYVNQSTNMTLRILADTLTAKAKSKHVASIDMLENMQLSQNMMGTYMDSDEVHLNSAGNAMYAHILHGKLRSMF